MTEQEFFAALEETHTLRRGHFVFASGRHATEKVDFDFLLAKPQHYRMICTLLAEKIAVQEFDYLMGPGVNGAVLAAGVAAALSERGRNVPWGHAQKDDGGGFKTDEPHTSGVRGKRVFLLDDVLTRGTTFVKVQTMLHELGAEVSGAVAVLSRMQVAALPSLPSLSWLFERKMIDYVPEECPVCSKTKNPNSSS